MPRGPQVGQAVVRAKQQQQVDQIGHCGIRGHDQGHSRPGAEAGNADPAAVPSAQLSHEVGYRPLGATLGTRDDRCRQPESYRFIPSEATLREASRR